MAVRPFSGTQPRSRVPVLATLMVAAAVSVLAGCGSSSSGSSTGGDVKEFSPPGDIPDNQVFVRFTPPAGDVTIKVPEGWARSESNGAVSFTDKLNTIQIQSRPLPQAPTIQSVKSTELPQVAQSMTNYQLQDVTSVDRSGGSAVLATYQAASPVNNVTGKSVPDAFERYAFWKAGTEAVLTLSGPVGADNVDPWRLVSDSVTWR